MFIKAYNKLKEPEAVATATTKTGSECAENIPLAAKKCGHCGNTDV